MPFREGEKPLAAATSILSETKSSATEAHVTQSMSSTEMGINKNNTQSKSSSESVTVDSVECDAGHSRLESSMSSNSTVNIPVVSSKETVHSVELCEQNEVSNGGINAEARKFDVASVTSISSDDHTSLSVHSEPSDPVLYCGRRLKASEINICLKAGPCQMSEEYNFPTSNVRNLSHNCFYREMPDETKHNRTWLSYSKARDKASCGLHVVFWTTRLRCLDNHRVQSVE